jgi:hypothetical protein
MTLPPSVPRPRAGGARPSAASGIALTTTEQTRPGMETAELVMLVPSLNIEPCSIALRGSARRPRLDHVQRTCQVRGAAR